jgi:cytochrome P450
MEGSMSTILRHAGLADQAPDAASVLAWFRRMRDHEPVSHDEEAGVWHVFRYSDVARVLADSTAFSSDFSSLMPPNEDVDRFIRGNMLRKDPPQHRKLRVLVNKAFTPATVATLAPRIAAIVDELLDAVHGQDRIELVSDLAHPLPLIVIAELLGIPLEDRPTFRRWAESLVRPEAQSSFVPNAKRVESMGVVMREMNTYCLDQIRMRRVRPTEDLISKLTTAEVDGQRLDDEEIVGFVGLLLLAGHITTTALLGNAILCLAEHPQVAAQLRDRPAGLPTAIEEVLRYRTPLAVAMRRTAVPVRFDDDTGAAPRTVPAGQIVLAWLASANRDEGRFLHPDRFDPGREPNAQLGFGHGLHFCLGAPLARLETRISLEILLARTRELSVPDGVEYYDARGIFGATRLPVDVRWVSGPGHEPVGRP